jgi:hypothetical protein
VSLRQELALANGHIARAKERIAQQLQRVERLKRDGKDTADAQAMLRVTRLSLALQGHRQHLADKLAHQGAPEPPGRAETAGGFPPPGAGSFLDGLLRGAGGHAQEGAAPTS